SRGCACTAATALDVTVPPAREGPGPVGGLVDQGGTSGDHRGRGRSRCSRGTGAGRRTLQRGGVCLLASPGRVPQRSPALPRTPGIGVSLPRVGGLAAGRRGP